MALNEIILIGRLTKDVETQTVNDALNARFTLVVDRGYKSKGENKPQADFIPVSVWRKTAEFAENHFYKGKQVYVVGSLEIYSYEKDGEMRQGFRINASKIGFADSAKGESNKPQNTNSAQSFNDADDEFTQFSNGDFADDLPF